MAQVCDGYTSNCLMGNWYEEKFAPEQPLRTNAFQPVQQLDPNISFADAFGNLLPLERMRRAQPWITTGLVQDCSEKLPAKTTVSFLQNKQNIDMLQKSIDHRSLNKRYLNGSAVHYPESNPHHLHVRSPAAVKMFGESTKGELRVYRAADTCTFRSILKPNCLKSDKLAGQTTYNTFFGEKKLPKIEGDSVVQRPMVGEKFVEGNEPKQNTAVQRSWQQSGDMGLEWCRKSKLSSALLTASKPSSSSPAPNFLRQRSEITLQPNKLVCYR